MKVNEIEGFANSRGLHHIRHFFAQFPTLRSQASILGSAYAVKGQTNPETDCDDKPGKPRLVIPDRFVVFWPKMQKNDEMEWDDKLGKPRLVIPVRFGVFWPKRAQNTRNGPA